MATTFADTASGAIKWTGDQPGVRTNFCSCPPIGNQLELKVNLTGEIQTHLKLDKALEDAIRTLQDKIKELKIGRRKIHNSELWNLYLYFFGVRREESGEKKNSSWDSGLIGG